MSLQFNLADLEGTINLMNGRGTDDMNHNRSIFEEVHGHTIDETDLGSHAMNGLSSEPGNHERQFTDVLTDALERGDVQTWLAPYLSIFTLGGGLGFAAGISSKRMGGYLLKTSIGSLLIIQALRYKGYLKIDWEAIKDDVNRYMAEQKTTSHMQFAIANIGPILAGFGIGFQLG